VPDSRNLPASLLSVLATQMYAALEHHDLAETAQEVGPLAEADRVRSALLAAVGHDLRRPLAAVTAAVSGLRSSDLNLSTSDRVELLETAAESLDALAALVTNLLDASRLRAGALAVTLEPVAAADVILPALDELGMGPEQVELDLPDHIPPVLADSGLLQRVLDTWVLCGMLT
jgi:two-component system, OmpR family, sensor histidine kinase KdpD